MLPSEQSLGWKLHPCTGMHESTVQGLPSLQVMAMLWHVPCSQESVVQAPWPPTLSSQSALVVHGGPFFPGQPAMSLCWHSAVFGLQVSVVQ